MVVGDGGEVVVEEVVVVVVGEVVVEDVVVVVVGEVEVGEAVEDVVVDAVEDVVVEGVVLVEGPLGHGPDALKVLPESWGVKPEKPDVHCAWVSVLPWSSPSNCQAPQ